MSIDLQLLVNTLQAEIIAHCSWRGSVDTLADITLRAMGMTNYAQSDLDEIRKYLRSQPLRTALNAIDCALWVDNDGLMRFVDQQPSTLKAAKLRTAHYPGAGCCRYCLLPESQKVNTLRQETDHNGHYVSGSFIHEQCRLAWRRLRMQVAAAGENHE